MKTIEEKAKECIDNLIDSLSLEVNHEESNYDAGQVHALSDYGKEIYKVGFLEGQSNPKIKQLEWEDNKNCLTKGITARTSFCTYQTMELSNGNSSLFTDNRIICQDFPIDYIKQYAQEDFEARVKECLIIE